MGAAVGGALAVVAGVALVDQFGFAGEGAGDGRLVAAFCVGAELALDGWRLPCCRFDFRTVPGRGGAVLPGERRVGELGLGTSPALSPGEVLLVAGELELAGRIPAGRVRGVAGDRWERDAGERREFTPGAPGVGQSPHTHTSDRGFPAAAGTTGWPKWFAVGLGRVERPVK